MKKYSTANIRLINGTLKLTYILTVLNKLPSGLARQGQQHRQGSRRSPETGLRFQREPVPALLCLNALSVGLAAGKSNADNVAN